LRASDDRTIKLWDPKTGVGVFTHLRILVDKAPGSGEQQAMGFLREVESVVHE